MRNTLWINFCLFISILLASSAAFAAQSAYDFPKEQHPTVAQLKYWGFSNEAELRKWQKDVAETNKNVEEVQRLLDAAAAEDEAGYTSVTGDDIYISDAEFQRQEELRLRMEEEEAQKRSAERLHKIKAYMSSPVIPYEPDRYEGLKAVKKENNAAQKYTGASQTWATFLNRTDVLDNYGIYAVINSGSVIPAMLITGVNSDLPGNMVAQVSENVYDSPTGKRLLIPQGSRLFGTYDSKVIFGQKRPLIKWTRLIYPDGSTLDLMNMPGTDRRGYAGFKAKVNNHYWPMLTNAAMVSVFAAVADYYDDNKVVINQPTINLGKNSMPVGSIILWPTEAETPDGWLACNGMDFDTAMYTDLHEVLPSGKLPNLNTEPSKKWVIKSADSTSAITALLGGAAATTYYDDNRSTVGRELGRTLQQMATKLLDKYLDMAPTLIVKPGYKFAVVVNKEIELPVKEPYKAAKFF